MKRCVWKDDDEVTCYKVGTKCDFPNYPELCRNYNPFPISTQERWLLRKSREEMSK